MTEGRNFYFSFRCSVNREENDKISERIYDKNSSTTTWGGPPKPWCYCLCISVTVLGRLLWSIQK